MTPGDVVYENDLIQLIQYKPTTPEVASRPLVIIPPCINKYYILDLQPENSFVAHALAEGNTVFMVSWRNVEAEQGHYTWDDYLELGVFTRVPGRQGDRQERPGQCARLLRRRHVARRGARRARGKEGSVASSATFLTTMLDFSDTGQIGLFVDEPSVARAKRPSAPAASCRGRSSTSCSRSCAPTTWCGPTW